MKRLRVLIVDDAPRFLESTADFLSRDPRATVVGCAADGAEGVALSRDLEPDLVIMDVAMPLMNGFAAATAIKAARPSTTIVLTSLHDEPAYRESAALAGADRFTPKRELAGALMDLLDCWEA